MQSAISPTTSPAEPRRTAAGVVRAPSFLNASTRPRRDTLNAGASPKVLRSRARAPGSQVERRIDAHVIDGTYPAGVSASSVGTGQYAKAIPSKPPQAQEERSR